MVNPNFTPVIDPLSTGVHYNVSQMVANQPLQMTTPAIWVIFSLLGIGLLIYSVKHHEDMEGDLCGGLAFIFLLVSSWQAFMVDTVTSTGIAGITVPNGTPNTMFVSLESHQVYHYDLWGYVLAIICLVSIANLFLLWLRHKRITETPTEQIDHRDLVRSSGSTSKDSKTNNKED